MVIKNKVVKSKFDELNEDVRNVIIEILHFLPTVKVEVSEKKLHRFINVLNQEAFSYDRNPIVEDITNCSTALWSKEEDKNVTEQLSKLFVLKHIRLRNSNF